MTYLDTLCVCLKSAFKVVLKVLICQRKGSKRSNLHQSEESHFRTPQNLLDAFLFLYCP